VGGKVLIANGVEDHVHMLCSLKPQHAVAEVVKTLKGASSAWFNREAGKGTVHWQDGYGAFTVSLSQKDATYAYIAAQEEHHRTRTFAEEYEAFLVRHGIDFDPRFHLD
jgi:REP element-mobilizing transposase RayT